MDYDKDKVDEMVLALLFLTLHGDGRAWKGHDWDAMDRLFNESLVPGTRGVPGSSVFPLDVYATDEAMTILAAVPVP